MPGTVFVVHAVDAEGPLYESLEATFARIKEAFELELEPSRQTLDKLRSKEIPCFGKEDAIAEFVREDLLNYNDNWDKIRNMHEVLMSHQFRSRVLDSWGQEYCFSWFCMDHVGYSSNPRRRDMGFHAVFEQYVRLLKEHDCARDRIFRHHHPMSFSRDAHRHGANYSFSNLHNEILARRIIDHAWFPAASREALSENMDINLWLEQWIPFDYANLNLDESGPEQLIAAGRVDWRGAPTDWSIYHPSVWDHRKPGELHRFIGRCLNLNSRHSNITEYEFEKAFRKAEEGQDVLVSFSNHDHRDMLPEAQWVMNTVQNVAGRHPTVRIRWSTAVEAMRAVLGLSRQRPACLQARIDNHSLYVSSDAPIWGPQPFLSIRTKEGNYYHDNFIIDSNTHWTYPFDHDSILLEAVASLGVATNDTVGNTTVMVCDLVRPQEWKINYLNANDWFEEN